jgi:hypothetical protein
MKIPVQIMHTEEDTFNTLRRIPFIQMIREWSDIGGIVPRSPECQDFFKARGWTWDEYMEIYEVKKEQGHSDVFPK